VVSVPLVGPLITRTHRPRTHARRTDRTRETPLLDGHLLDDVPADIPGIHHVKRSVNQDDVDHLSDMVADL